MKLYYYLVFRVYFFYVDVVKEKDIPGFVTAVVISVLMFFNIFTAYAITNQILGFHFKYEIYVVSVLGVIVFFGNFFFLIKPKKFLEMGFTKSNFGTVLILAYILISVALFIMIANIHRTS